MKKDRFIIFLEFLKKNGAYEKYKTNIINTPRRGYYLRYLDRINPYCYLSAPFDWVHSPEGSVYWGKLNNRWIVELYDGER